MLHATVLDVVGRTCLFRLNGCERVPHFFSSKQYSTSYQNFSGRYVASKRLFTSMSAGYIFLPWLPRKRQDSLYFAENASSNNLIYDLSFACETFGI